jgi:glycosyltransferase involved in cell wall biosynthesis
MKKQIIYLSPDCFFDTDALVLRHLAEEYDVTWVALVTVAGSRVSDNSVVESIAQEAGVKLVLKHLHWRKFSLKQLWFDLRLLRELKALRADLIYIEDVADFYFYLLQPFYLKKKTTVYAIHDVVPHSNRSDLRSKFNAALYRITRELLYGWADNYHIFSRTEYHKFREIQPTKNAFYTRLLLQTSESPALQSDSPVVSGPGPVSAHCRFLFFGLIAYYKGLDLLIEAVESLVQEGHTNFSLTIAGRGPYWPECETLIRSNKHYNLRICYIPEDDIPELFSSHHFIVLPYRDASQSGPQRISLQYNLPVIASDVEGLSDFVDDGKNGFIFSIDTDRAQPSLTECLRQCITMNDQQYMQLRKELKIWKEDNYRIEDTMAPYFQFLNERLEGKKD